MIVVTLEAPTAASWETRRLKQKNLEQGIELRRLELDQLALPPPAYDARATRLWLLEAKRRIAALGS